MNKKRLFYLDFIRAVSTLIIVLTHYNALYYYNVTNPDAYVGNLYIFNIYIGEFGVSLFLILSGASLMLTTKEHFKLKDYYKKRFLKIFPYFYFIYIIFFIYGLLNNGSSVYYLTNLRKYRLLYTFLGLDGYLSRFGIQTFYLIGEWFLGFIIIFYLIFPFIYKIVNKYPKIFLVLYLIFYFIFIYFYKDYQNLNIIIPTKLLDLLFGMYFIKYVKKINYVELIICSLFLIVNQIMNLPINYTMKGSLVGISAFVILAFIGEKLKNVGIVNRLSEYISSKSYSCFLVHHQITFIIISFMPLANINNITSCVLFIFTVILIFITIEILDNMYNYFVKIFKKVILNK